MPLMDALGDGDSVRARTEIPLPATFPHAGNASTGPLPYSRDGKGLQGRLRASGAISALHAVVPAAFHRVLELATG